MIVRETQEDKDRSYRSHDTSSTNVSITDEELVLLGDPWARPRKECFVVSSTSKVRELDGCVAIRRGELNMFLESMLEDAIVGCRDWLVPLSSVVSTSYKLVLHILRTAIMNSRIVPLRS
jgi:hypothetical protein